MSANKKQLEVINNIEGIYLVDAGAGTGKTYTITQRYLNMLNNSISPQDILLITFTKNTAINMKNKINSLIDKKKTVEIIDAPILTFDSFCFKIVSKYGLNAPNLIGVKQNLSSFKLISQSSILKRKFTFFYNQFLEKNSTKYENILITLFNHFEIYSLIEQLLSKGIYPTKEGWFLDGETKIQGNLEKYLLKFNQLNKEKYGKNKQNLIKNDLISKFNSENKYLNLPDDFFIEKRINPIYGEIAFREDRKDLLNFIRDIYFQYVEFMVKENILSFSLTSMFAFLILYEDKNIREINSFNYVMVDEFQDTNELQFMLILLLLKKSNLCVVGDWKQGIYGFRNATITNIRDFKEKISLYKEILNKNKQRVNFDINEINFLDFDINYRSSQKILDFSKKSLIINGKNEELNEEDIKKIQKEIISLKSPFDYDENSEIKFYLADNRENEIDFILKKAQEIVGIKEIKFFDSKTNKYIQRVVRYSDIVILSRNRNFGLDIQKKAFQYNIPAVYEGGVKIFEEEPSILLLAWLKLLLYIDKKEAWITILEKETYDFIKIKEILEKKIYPKDILNFRNNLIKNKKNINYLVDEIFNRYNINNNISNTIILVLENYFNSGFISINDLILFIEENISNQEIYNIETLNNRDSIKIQTIHSVKGLEYPIVFIANCNLSNFPKVKINSNSIFYNDLIGIRNKKIFSNKYNFIFDNWKTYLLNVDLSSDLDEERRLLYVAITRAMFNIYFTAYNPSSFFNNLCNNNFIKIEKSILSTVKNCDKINDNSLFIKTNIKKIPIIFSVHDFINIKENKIGRGKDFGTKIHKLVFRHILNLPIKTIQKEYKKDFDNIKKYLDDNYSSAKLEPEIECFLNIDDILIKGVIDLLIYLEDKIEIIDWKTNMVKDNLSEYEKQLSIYYHTLKQLNPKKEVICKIFWSYSGEVQQITPLSLEEIKFFIKKY